MEIGFLYSLVMKFCSKLLLLSPLDASRTYYQGTGWRYTSHFFIVLWSKLFSCDLFVSMNSVQPGSVYIFSALAIAVVITTELETAAAVQASLLLRCGDIELNPGPELGRFSLSV